MSKITARLYDAAREMFAVLATTILLVGGAAAIVSLSIGAAS